MQSLIVKIVGRRFRNASRNEDLHMIDEDFFDGLAIQSL